MGRFAEIGQARYVIIAFVVIEENWDPLENYLFGLVCVAAERKITGKLGVFKESERFEDAAALSLFKLGWFPPRGASGLQKEAVAMSRIRFERFFVGFFPHCELNMGFSY